MKGTQIKLGNATKGVAGEGAYSLLEVLIAVFLMVVLFVAVSAGISTTFSLLQATRENVRATQIMVSRFERLRLCAWSNGQLFNPNVIPPTFVDSFYPMGINGSSNNGTVYYGTMTITANPNLAPAASYGTNMALVTVVVTWTNGGNGTISSHSRSMSTYVSRYGMQNYIYYH